MIRKLKVFIAVALLFTSCTNRNSLVDRSKLLGVDYRLFQQTPAWELAEAVQDGDIGRIKKEIAINKIPVDSREPRFGKTLLMLAVMNMNYTSTKALLELGADPNLQDRYFGDSALMDASSLESPLSGSEPRFLQLLLKFGGDPNAVQQGPKTVLRSPLMIACEKGNLDYMKILVKAGAKVDTVNKYGDSPLKSASLAAGLYRRPELVLYLIDNGAGFKKVLYKTIEGEEKYLTDDMRYWHFDLGSAEYKKKMQIADFLNKNGMDYRATEIPKTEFDNYPKEYLEKY